MPEKHRCVLCNVTLRKYTPGEPKCHRKCWLSLRTKQDRHLDFLFAKDRKKEDMKKTVIIQPEDDSPKDYTEPGSPTS